VLNVNANTVQYIKYITHLQIQYKPKNQWNVFNWGRFVKANADAGIPPPNISIPGKISARRNWAAPLANAMKDKSV
jgi:hypothetical protein